MLIFGGCVPRAGLLHVSQNLAADQDALVLHRQDQRLHRANVEAKAVGNRRGWRKYYMASLNLCFLTKSNLTLSL